MENFMAVVCGISIGFGLNGLSSLSGVKSPILNNNGSICLSFLVVLDIGFS